MKSDNSKKSGNLKKTVHAKKALHEKSVSWRDELGNSRLTRKVVEHFEAGLVDIAANMLVHAQADVPELAAAPPEILTRVKQHCELHVQAMLTIMKNEFEVERADLTFVRENAAVRAQEGYPLPALLHAYRAGHKATWESMCRLFAVPGQAMSPEVWQMILALSVFAMEYTNAISNAAASAFADETRHQERVTGHARSEFLNALVTNDHKKALAARARRFGLSPEADFLVFIAALDDDYTTVNGEELVKAEVEIGNLLNPSSGEFLVGVRHGEIVGVVRARSGFDEDIEIILDKSAPRWMTEKPFRVGISSPRNGLESVGLCYQDARHALGHATEARSLVRFCNVPPFEHLLATADSSTYRLRPPWLDTLLLEDKKSNGALLSTLRTYLDSGLSAKETASKLSIHLNTVYHRMRKVEEVTGQSSQHIPGLLNVITVMSLHGPSDS